MLEKTPESPLDSMEIKSLNPKGNQPWIFIGRTDAEAEAPILWSPDAKNQLTGKYDAGKDWGQEEKGATEDQMIGWHHQLNGHEFEQTPGDSEGQRSLACCSPWGRKELNTTSNWTPPPPNLYLCTRVITECGTPQHVLLKFHFIFRPHGKQKKPSALCSV